MANIIAFANHKGGVGKTTSVANIGAALARKGKKVLVVDLDAQQNLTSCFLPDTEVDNIEVSIFDALKGTATLPIRNVKPNLDLVPSGINLAMAEIELSQKMARERLLARLLKPVEGKYDFILLDCPPSLAIITTNALTAAKALYIPLTAEALPLKGMKMLEGVVNQIQEALNTDLSLSGIFLTRYGARKSLNNMVLEAIQEKYKNIVFQTKIRDCVAIAEAPLMKQDIAEYSPNSNGAKDYESLTEEILKRWSK